LDENNLKNHNNLKKGLYFGIMCLFLVGIQPIIANSRLTSLDPYIYATMTCLVEALMFLPLMLFERTKLKNSAICNQEQINEVDSLLNGWRNHKLLLAYIGINFGIAQILFFVAYQIAGSINGSLAQKTTVIFGLLFGYLINKEQITKTQIIFSFILFFGLTVAITQGSFNLLQLNIGVITMLISSTLWMIGHAATKPILSEKEGTPIQFVFIRNSLSGTFLFFTYFLFFPIENIGLLGEQINIFHYTLMGIVYGSGLFFWYKLLSLVDVSKAAVIVSPTPIVTAFFATFLGEIFTIFHLIGLIIIIISIYVIVREKNT